jgi:hypothetical protein
MTREFKRKTSEGALSSILGRWTLKDLKMKNIIFKKKSFERTAGRRSQQECCTLFLNLARAEKRETEKREKQRKKRNKEKRETKKREKQRKKRNREKRNKEKRETKKREKGSKET